VNLLAVNYWVVVLAEAEDQEDSQVVGIFVMLSVSLLLFSYLRNVTFLELSATISKNLFLKMFNHLLAIKIQFFDENPSGRLMNRFSKDLFVLDSLFPSMFVTLLIQIFMLGGLFVVITIVNPYVLI
jgi:ABC-type multidrug transport system fused ATPase/permease subunit